MQRVVIWTATSAVINEDERHQQALRGEAWALKQGAQVKTTLKAESLKPTDIDLYALFRCPVSPGFTAYQQLADLCVLQAFDVLWIETFSRLSRAVGPLGYLVQAVARSGASVYISAKDQWITPQNWIEEMAMVSMSALSFGSRELED